MFVSCATLKIYPQHREAFWAMAKLHAQNTLALEDGCQRFDVLSDKERPNEVLLYQVYDDEAALDAHLNSVHFQTFQSAVTEMIINKSVSTYGTVFRQSA